MSLNQMKDFKAIEINHIDLCKFQSSALFFFFSAPRWVRWIPNTQS